MMKSKDCAVATALVLNGYLRANEGETLSPADSNRHLADALRAVRSEWSDWAENLASEDAALEPRAISVELLESNGALVSRSPYNLISAACALLSEAFDLNGPPPAGERDRVLAALDRPEPTTAPEAAVLIGAANDLAAEIDAATERPVGKLAAWDVLCGKLRSLNVNVEEVCHAPSNW